MNGFVMFHVIGEAVPQGSMRAFATSHGKVVSVSDNAGRLARWRGDIRATATRSFAEQGLGPIDGEVAISVTFEYARPRSHFRSDGVSLRKGAPTHPRPDIDKLARAVLDALTGIAYHDDSQVVVLALGKEYSAAARAVIVITRPEEIS